VAAIAYAGGLLALSDAQLLIGLLIVVGGLYWLGARRKCLFHLHIEDGQVRETAGHVPQRFVADVEQLCRFWQIDRGWIKGRRRGRRIVISVGGGIGPEHAQVFRNAWNYPVV
jgi:hypothetical protein